MTLAVNYRWLFFSSTGRGKRFCHQLLGFSGKIARLDNHLSSINVYASATGPLIIDSCTKRLVRKSSINMPNQELPFDQWLRPLTEAAEKLPSLACMLCETYSHLALHSNDQFLPTPVTNLPIRSDVGEYLAIDLGGTNLRIAFIALLGTEHDKRSPQIEKSHDTSVTNDSCDSYDYDFSKRFGRSWSIAERLKVEKAEDLFDWVGGCLAEIVRARICAKTTADDVPAEIPLGITFSFPMMYVCIWILFSNTFLFSAY